MCKKALNTNKSIEWGLQVICVISVIVFVVIALATFLLFISSYSYIFFGKALSSLWWRLPCSCEEVQEQGMWLYVWKEKEGLGEGEEARNDFPHTWEVETWIQSRYLHCRDTLKTSK